MHRVIIPPLLSARRLSERPECIPKSRSRGAKARGLAYERQVAKELGKWCKHSEWFEFEDSRGHGYCSPDFWFGVTSDYRSLTGFAILEIKYTWTLEGHLQMEQLYRPVLEKALGLKCLWMIEVCKILPSGSNLEISGTIGEAMRSIGGRKVVHWMKPWPLWRHPKAPVDTIPNVGLWPY